MQSDEDFCNEKWKLFKSQNDSEIVDLLYGQYLSKIRWNNCNYILKKWDEFSLLSVPIPTHTSSKDAYAINVKYYPFNLTDDRAVFILNFEFSK